MWKKAFDILFWLAVSVYFGGVLTLGAVVAPTIFSTARARHMSMPNIPPALEMPAQVGGELFGEALNRFAYIEYGAMAAILIALVGWFKFKNPVPYTAWVVALLWGGLAIVVAYDAGVVRSQVWTVRESVRTTAATRPVASAPATATSPALETTSAPAPVAAPVVVKLPALPWPEKEQFDALHKTSEELGKYKFYLLLGMVLIAAFHGLSSKGTDESVEAEEAVEDEPPPPPRKIVKKKRRDVLDP